MCRLSAITVSCCASTSHPPQPTPRSASSRSSRCAAALVQRARARRLVVERRPFRSVRRHDADLERGVRVFTSPSNSDSTHGLRPFLRGAAHALASTRKLPTTMLPTNDAAPCGLTGAVVDARGSRRSRDRGPGANTAAGHTAQRPRGVVSSRNRRPAAVRCALSPIVPRTPFRNHIAVVGACALPRDPRMRLAIERSTPPRSAHAPFASVEAYRPRCGTAVARAVRAALPSRTRRSI